MRSAHGIVPSYESGPRCHMMNCWSAYYKIVSVLHQDEGWIGKSIPDAQDFPRPERFPEGEARGKSRGSREISRDFPRSWVLHPETRGISRGRSPREIPRVEGCKTHDQGKSRGRRGWISQSIPSLGGARTFSHHYQGRFFHR